MLLGLFGLIDRVVNASLCRIENARNRWKRWHSWLSIIPSSKNKNTFNRCSSLCILVISRNTSSNTLNTLQQAIRIHCILTISTLMLVMSNYYRDLWVIEHARSLCSMVFGVFDLTALLASAVVVLGCDAVSIVA
jgi:hypothetical protein